MLAEHVFEHIPVDRIPAALSLCREHLQPGARLRIAVPDAHRTDARYAAENKPPASGHTIYFNIDSLSQAIRDAGMEPVPLEWFDPNGTFHRRDWNPADAMIRRSFRFDSQQDFRLEHRGETLHYTSLIVDAIRPAE
jgi:predicted SAM-dependent methyltransferase